MQNKRNVCTDQRIIGKAFFKMFLLIPTQSEQLFRVLLIKTMKMNKPLSDWQTKELAASESKQKLTVRIK